MSPSLRRKAAQGRTRRHVTLYTKPGCHLCEIAKSRLARARLLCRFDMEEIDITTDPALIERYDVRIPVVAIDGVEAFEHRVILDELLLALASPVAESGYGSVTEKPTS